MESFRRWSLGPKEKGAQSIKASGHDSSPTLHCSSTVGNESLNSGRESFFHSSPSTVKLIGVAKGESERSYRRASVVSKNRKLDTFIHLKQSKDPFLYS